MIMCIQNLVSISLFGLKILKKNTLNSDANDIMGHNSVANLRKMKIYNPAVDLVNNNVYTKFG